VKKPLCSILITTYNSIASIKQSMESVLNQIDDSFEVIVVDNFSNDGTLEYLRQLADEGKIRLIVKKCNRGEGRQIALKEARGRYVIARVDVDTVHNPVFNEILKLYIEKEAEIGEFVLNAGVLVSTKDFLLKIGGWRPLQWGENYELYKRLTDMGKLYVCRIEEASKHIKCKWNLMKRLKVAYVNYRDSLRMGLRFRVVAKELWKRCSKLGFLIRFIILCICWITHHFYTKYSTLKDVSWEEFYDLKMYSDELNFFEVYHPDKVIPPPPSIPKYPKMVTIFVGEKK